MKQFRRVIQLNTFILANLAHPGRKTMSLNLNSCVFAGRLTRDPEVKFLSGDRAVANFSIAINRQWKDSEGQKKEEVTFLDLVAYGRTAEIAGQYLTKARECTVEAHAKTESWEKDGQKRSKIVFVIDRLHLMGDAKDPGERQAEAAEPPPAPRRPASGASTDGDDEPPF